MILASLRVRDLATIADVTLELGPGLNVLTGETGAGKSMLVDALALLLGDRADRAAIRPGSARAVIEGMFDTPTPAVRARLEALGADADELVIRREVSNEGRSRAWINGSPATVSALAALSELVIDLHGQHQTVQLLQPATQRHLLDGFSRATAAADAVREAWTELNRLREARASLASRRDESQRRADWLRHVVQEIDAAQIRVGEDENLEVEINRLSQVRMLAEHAQRVESAIDGEEASARDALARADRALSALERIDPVAGAWREAMDAAYAAVDELSRTVADYRNQLVENPARLAKLERRRDVLFDLRRKHGANLAQVLQTRDEAQRELDLVDSAEHDLSALDRQITAASEQLTTTAAALSALRAQGAARMAREVSRSLPRLGLSSSEFSVDLHARAEPGPDGAEEVTFTVRLNQGMQPMPLARVASGGELSRLMLALKVVLAAQDEVPTLIFDEVDQGIGGEVGVQVGDALAKVSQRHQVLVITHLPQIAARADRHLVVAKATRGGIATSDVATLHGEDRVLELARMLGDADSEAARRMASSMVRR